MERPTIITADDQWHAYIADLLEQIRDSGKPVKVHIEETAVGEKEPKDSIGQAATKTKRWLGKRGGKHDKDL